MRHAGFYAAATVATGLVFSLLPACGRDEMGGRLDAAPDRPADLPAVADTVPSVEDLPRSEDLPSTPDLPPDLGPGDPVADPARTYDLLPDGIIADRPSDPPHLQDLPMDRPRDLGPDLGLDLGPETSPDLPSERPLVPDLQNLDKPPVYDQTLVTDGLVQRDSAAELCTSTGGEPATQSCCSTAPDFRDMCTTATGACGCSPANSITVRACICPQPSCFMPGYGCVGPGATCTVGMDQTCNDNLVISSIRGRCVENGRCVCTTGMSPTSGKCL